MVGIGVKRWFQITRRLEGRALPAEDVLKGHLVQVQAIEMPPIEALQPGEKTQSQCRNQKLVAKTVVLNQCSTGFNNRNAEGLKFCFQQTHMWNGGLRGKRLIDTPALMDQEPAALGAPRGPHRP